MDKILIDKLKKIKLLICDVDGVFTDGGFYINGENEEYKKFNALDGAGVVLLKAANISFALLSGRYSTATTARMKQLGCEDNLYQGHSVKIGTYLKIKEKFHLNDKEIAYAGDDLMDLPVLLRAGLGFGVANACDEVIAAADYVTEKSGGQGAVREIIELILKAQGKFKDAVKTITNDSDAIEKLLNRN